MRPTAPRILAILVPLLLAPATSAQDCVYLDDFDDNTTPDSWALFSTDTSRLQCVEQNGRLEFPAPNANPGGTHFSGVVSDGWAIDMEADWAVSIRYNLKFGMPTLGDTGLAFIVAFDFDVDQPGLFTGYSLAGGIEQESGLEPYYYETTRLWQNGATSITTETERDYDQSTIYIWYDASSGTISQGETLYVAEGVVSGINDLSVLTTARMGLVSYSFGSVPSWSGSQSWVDDFCIINGTLVGNLAGGCCIDGDVCIATLETECSGTWLGQGVFCDGPDAGCSGQGDVDLNFDGIVDGADLSILLSAWGCADAGCSADIDGSGTVDGADLTLLLSAWGSRS